MNIAPRFLGLQAISLRSSAIMSIALVVAALTAYWATPHLTEVTDAPSLEQTVPRQFGDWKELPSPYVQVSLSTGLDPNMDQPYDQTLMRTYVNSQGEQVMLALAWGKRQRQEVKIHRPDLCYVAQGFEIKSFTQADFSALNTPEKNIVGKNMIAMNSRGGEAVAYWIRIGNLYSENALASRFHLFKEGLAGRIPDGILVRASKHITSEEQPAKAFPQLGTFLAAFYAAASPELKTMMAP